MKFLRVFVNRFVGDFTVFLALLNLAKLDFLRVFCGFFLFWGCGVCWVMGGIRGF